MQTNTLIKTDGTTAALPPGPLSLEQMYAAIDCDTVERVQLSDTSELWCDENGLAVNNPRQNKICTALYKAAYPKEKLMFPEDWDDLQIVGNAILSENVNHTDE